MVWVLALGVWDVEDVLRQLPQPLVTQIPKELKKLARQHAALRVPIRSCVELWIGVWIVELAVRGIRYHVTLESINVFRCCD